MNKDVNMKKRFKIKGMNMVCLGWMKGSLGEESLWTNLHCYYQTRLRRTLVRFV